MLRRDFLAAVALAPAIGATVTAQQKSFPNEYVDSNFTSTGLAACGFGFPAGQVTIYNNGAGAAFIRLRSTGPASTSDFQLSSGETLTVREIGVNISGMAWAATSTGTVLRVGAWG